MAYQAFKQEYMQIPPVTRAYTTACVITTIAVHLEVITPLQINFDPGLIFWNCQLWRLVTNFVFFGTFGFNVLFDMLLVYKYCRKLEEGSFRGKTGDFVFMFLFEATIMTIMGTLVNLAFLRPAVTTMLFHVWGRRNPHIRVRFFSIFTLPAPFLPWVWVAFLLLCGSPIMVYVIGIVCGHVYYFLEDIYPRQDREFKILHTPQFLKWMFDPPPDAAAFDPLPEQDRPDGFAWGNVGIVDAEDEQRQ